MAFPVSLIRKSDSEKFLAKLADLRAWLDQCTELSEIKKVADMTAAATEFARQQNLGRDVIREGRNIELRAKRQMGKLLAKMEKAKGGQPYQSSTDSSREPVGNTLADAGISKKLSMVCQRLAALDSAEFETFLESNRSVTSIMQKISREQRRNENKVKVSNVGSLDQLVGSLFGCIVIDPPWAEYGVDWAGRGHVEYARMSVDTLAELPIEKLADKDSHLWLWATDSMYLNARRLIEDWGFSYSSSIIWDKVHFGLGSHIRLQHEFLLFARRGAQPFKRHDVGSVVRIPRSKHSQKPDEFYELIESCSEGPYLDVFARRDRAGWTTWGENGVAKNGCA